MYVQERRGRPKDAYWSPQRTDDWPWVEMPIGLQREQQLYGARRSLNFAHSRFRTIKTVQPDDQDR